MVSLRIVHRQNIRSRKMLNFCVKSLKAFNCSSWKESRLHAEPHCGTLSHGIEAQNMRLCGYIFFDKLEQRIRLNE